MHSFILLFSSCNYSRFANPSLQLSNLDFDDKEMLRSFTLFFNLIPIFRKTKSILRSFIRNCRIYNFDVFESIIPFKDKSFRKFHSSLGELLDFLIYLFYYFFFLFFFSSSYSRGTEVEKTLQRSIETKTRYASSDE